MLFYLQLIAAVILDFLFGDPSWWPHPVRGIGWLCTRCEQLTRRWFANLYLGGTITATVVIFVTCLAVYLTVAMAMALSPTVGAIVAVVVLYTALAARDLLRHAIAVYNRLQPRGTLEGARGAVAMIVGRDTGQLSREGVVRACIETVAENMVDGVTAPLFFAVLGSLLSGDNGIGAIGGAAVGAYFYKAINTMDSMIGYRNERYLKFGRVAARLDDVANFMPARVSAVCIIVAAFFLKLDYREAARILRRDRLNHNSPNSGHTEAAVAGALGIRLGGPSSYFGTMVDKPYLGDGQRPPTADDIRAGNGLMLVGSLIFFLLLVALHLFLNSGA
jgi:adenosylcobinamide-phosphate synthase